MLLAQSGDAQAGFLPQNWQSHTKQRVQDVLRCLGRGGLKLGGRLNDKKSVLAERLSHWLNKVLEAGRARKNTGGEDDVPADGEGFEGETDAQERQRKARRVLVEHTGGAADVPADAVVTPEQAESALGHVQATDLDAEVFEAVDDDQREEEMALIGRLMNPTGVDYSCLAWSPVSDGDKSVAMGWPRALQRQELTNADFACAG